MLLGAHSHARGWPIPTGGSQAITDAMDADLLDHGGEIILNFPVSSLAQARGSSGAKAILLDLSAAGLADVAGAELPTAYLRRLASFRYGNAVSKVDFALSGPVPWTNTDLAAAPTVHLGGTRAAMTRAEAEVAAGSHPQEPFVLACQPSTADSSRAPVGHHVLWTYTHVPAGSAVDMTEAVIRRFEQFAPNVRDVILATHSITAQQYSQYNPNYVGGDFGAGAVSTLQLLKRPVISRDPWADPGQRHLPMFVLDSAGSLSPRPLRLVRCPLSPQEGIRVVPAPAATAGVGLIPERGNKHPGRSQLTKTRVDGS